MEAENNKRVRVVDDSDESPDAKRFRSELLDILSDDDDAASAAGDDGESSPSAASTDDLANVMRLLEEEISLPPPPPSEPADNLGFLLEASDDELGLPPPAPEKSVADLTEDRLESVGSDPIWGFNEDEIISYDALGGNSDHSEGSVVLEELFDYADPFGGSSDYSDFYWRLESLPAV
ncbi:hypothetical protein QJS10_CPA01g01447 [Acorus calamus]|uniref:Uncharacterized protein n=1 Tax=Acorus calamus TaxID=4465 RepID=A0AAV9FL77_ACOCL|nr:hypothetical protein QJS10_CPA01g01447 [Acorus calamus]